MKKKPFLQLSRVIEDAGYTQQELAAALDMCEGGLSQRLHGRTDWRRGEIVAVCQIVHIPSAQIGALFFPEVDA
jgi:hypothetical protein